MYGVDKTNFISYLQNFTNQIVETKQIFEKATYNLKKQNIRNIIYLGMGGSAIAGDIIRESLFDNLKIPVQVNRSYDIPAFCSKDSLIVACSYSGDTEETLSAVTKAMEKGAQVAVVTSGGTLGKLADNNKWTILTVPGGLPPRQAFGYMFFSVLRLFISIDACLITETEIDNIIKLSSKVTLQNNHTLSNGRILSKEIARQIQNKMPIIYSPAPYFGCVAIRWKNQFQENAKSMAFCNVIPEMNHNEIVGWEMEHTSLKDFIVIFLETENVNPRIAARINLTKNIIRDKGGNIVEIFAEGDTYLEQILYFIILGDWVTYYLALFNEKDPLAILNIDYLKSELKKLN